MEKKKALNGKNIMILLSFMAVMVVMGASDSLRGVFSLIFQDHFSLTTSQLSMIITVSYIGNLVFLFFGGSVVDRFEKKKVYLGILLLWALGAAIFLTTDSYYALLVGMFICMGASTLMNTTINILVPTIFVSAPGLVVNVLFFVQGIGTSGAQNIVGKYAGAFQDWKYVNVFLVILAAVGFVLACLSVIPNPRSGEKKAEKGSYGKVMRQPVFLYLVFIFGFYFIAEHGILNWLVLYGKTALEVSQEKAALYLSLFFGGMTVGRLVFAPAVQKLGEFRSIFWFATVGGVLYLTGILIGKPAILLLSAAGLFLSIVYPTLVLLMQKVFDPDCVATAAGAVISIATLFDIGFNAVFGKLIDQIGIHTAFYVLPVSMAAFWVLYLVFCKKYEKTAR